jgi:Uma2 family endonuclease
MSSIGWALPEIEHVASRRGTPTWEIAYLYPYQIVDPQERRIIVLTLDGDEYRVHGEFGPGETASSVLLPGFSVSVGAVLAAEKGRNN